MRSYLIMPIQRIPRYLLLVKELLKNTPEDHPDFVSLAEAQQGIDDAANHMNVAIKQREYDASIQITLVYWLVWW